MSIGFDTDLRNNRALAIVAAIDAGVDEYSSGHLFIYSGERPATGEAVDEYDNELLVDFLFSFPCGTVSNGILTFGTIQDVESAAAGIATWARITDTDDVFVMDLSVTDTEGSGDVKIDSTGAEIVDGILVRCTVATITEGNS